MSKTLRLLAVMVACTFPLISSAQKLERTKNWEVGDKLTFNWVLSGKAQRMLEETVDVTETETKITYKVGDRSYDAMLSNKDMSYPKGICLSNGQACEFSPAYVWVTFPLEKGRKWSGTMKVTGETFISEVAYERTVEGIEKIKTAAGQFEAYRVSGSGRIKATDKNGTSPSTGKESNTDWFATINGKLVPVKTEYKNSYGERFTRELVAAEVK
ncbi:MAG: hypothetical protein K2Y35_02750 [Burkholderiales bacterium]|nr:hypothetical protein [Burkholderiales bacterium]